MEFLLRINLFFHKIAGISIVSLLFFTVFFVNNHQNADVSENNSEEEEIRALFNVQHKIKKEKEGVFRLYDGDGEITGNVISLAPSSDDLSGYGTKIRVFIHLDHQNMIKSVEIGANNETRGFIEMARSSGFFNSWNGLSVEEAAKKKVDTVSGATMSTSAVLYMVKKNIAHYIGTKIEPVKRKEGFSVIIISMILLVYSLFSFFFPKKTARLRTLHLVAIVVIFGFIGGHLLSIETIKNALINNVFTFFSLFLFILAVFLLIIKQKNFYCTMVCPFGAMQELAGRVPAKKIELPLKAMKLLKIFKRLFLYALFAMLIFNATADFTLFEPFGAFRFAGVSYFSIAIALIALTLSFFIRKPWCRFFCPTGEIFEMMKQKKAKSEKSGCKE